jgi:hypothetical protein
MSDDTRTKNAKQLLAMMKATMNLDLDELIKAGVIEDRSGQECSAWTKWNKDAPTFIAKLDDRSLNSLAALIKHKFSDAFPPSADDLLRQAIEALRHADMFITNGVENGYIRLPSPPDPALETPKLIRAVLTAYDKREQS